MVGPVLGVARLEGDHEVLPSGELVASGVGGDKEAQVLNPVREVVPGTMLGSLVEVCKAQGWEVALVVGVMGVLVVSGDGEGPEMVLGMVLGSLVEVFEAQMRGREWAGEVVLVGGVTEVLAVFGNGEGPGTVLGSPVEVCEAQMKGREWAGEMALVGGVTEVLAVPGDGEGPSVVPGVERQWL